MRPWHRGRDVRQREIPTRSTAECVRHPREPIDRTANNNFSTSAAGVSRRAARGASGAPPPLSSERLLFGSRSLVRSLPMYQLYVGTSVTNATLADVRVGSRQTSALILAFDAFNPLRDCTSGLTHISQVFHVVPALPGYPSVSLPGQSEVRATAFSRGVDVFLHPVFRFWYIPLDKISPRTLPRFYPVPPVPGSPVSKISLVNDLETITAGSVESINVRDPYLARTVGHARKDSELCSYTCNSVPGDCGSIVYSVDGPVGMHVGWADLPSHPVNIFVPFMTTRRQESRKGRPNPVQRRPTRQLVCELHLEGGKPGELRLEGGKPVHTAAQQAAGSGPKPKPKKESLVSISPAPSDHLGHPAAAPRDNVSAYVSTLINPWGSEAVRLPDHVVTPTAVARMFANRTYTLGATATAGPNFLFGLNTRFSNYQVGPSTISEPALSISTGGAANVDNLYRTTPGNILTPIQWGGPTYPNPSVAFGNATGAAWAAGSSAWGDDFGTSSAGTIPYVSAYRTLASAIRVRVVGLPPSQFMTPGKIYFTQIRYDREDLPITEQDFVVLEQRGRASHVSADAVRAAGSKTIFWTPDGQEKFGMTSNFLLAPGIFETSTQSPYAVYRMFPDVPSAFAGGRALSAIIPYQTAGGVGSGSAVADNPDQSNADGTSVLLVAYFGAADGVVLEVNYASVVEYIPNKSSPAGVDTAVQLPSGSAMDAIFSAAAVCSQYKPLMIQAPGDKTVTSTLGTPSANTEAARAKNDIVRLARSRVGASLESNWLWDLISKGNIGNGKLQWNFA